MPPATTAVRKIFPEGSAAPRPARLGSKIVVLLHGSHFDSSRRDRFESPRSAGKRSGRQILRHYLAAASARRLASFTIGRSPAGQGSPSCPASKCWISA